MTGEDQQQRECVVEEVNIASSAIGASSASTVVIQAQSRSTRRGWRPNSYHSRIEVMQKSRVLWATRAATYTGQSSMATVCAPAVTSTKAGASEYHESASAMIARCGCRWRSR